MKAKKHFTLFILFQCLQLTFALAQQFNVVGDATQTSCECYKLTPNTSYQGGSIWNLNQINLNNSFDFNFKVYLGCTDNNGADGICFVLQNSNVNVALNGGGLGYETFPGRSIGVEIDTYTNSNYNDIAADHVGLNSNGVVTHNLVAAMQASATTANIEDCNWHNFRVVWNAPTNVISVYFDNVLRFNYTFAGGLITSIFLGNPNVYWGFTGATGGLSNLQQVCLNINSAFTAGTNFSSCDPNNVQFTDNSQSGLNNIVSYAWDFGDGTTSNLQNPIHSFAGTGTYTVSLTITDQSLCTKTTTNTVTIFNTPQATIVPQNMQCGAISGSANLTMNAGQAPFTVTCATAGATIVNNTPTTFTINNVGLGAHTLTITDANGCSITENFTINQIVTSQLNLTATDAGCTPLTLGSITASVTNAALPISYSINGQAGQTSNTFLNLAVGNYTVTITDANGCTANQSIAVNQTPPPTFSLSTTDAGCSGANGGSITANIITGISPFSYSINGQAAQASNIFNNLNVGNYIVIAIDANGCTSNQNASINFTQIALASINSFSLCSNEDTIINPTALGGAPPYTFTLIDLNNSTNTQTTPFDLQAVTTTNYNVIATDVNGCSSNTVNFTMQVKPNPTINFSTDVTAGCKPLCVNFTSTSDIPNSTCNWLVGDQNTYQIDNFSHCFFESGVFDVALKVTSPLGCASFITKSELINVEELPRAFFSLSPEETFLSAPEIAIYDFSDTTISNLRWDFGDNTMANGFVKSHAFSDTGTFCIQLKTFNNAGCVDSAKKCIIIKPEHTFYIPNSFSPNGDLLNDIFEPQGTEIKSMSMYIYNRWGEPIFKTINSKEIPQWDGGNLPQGVYTYFIEVNFMSQENKTYFGSLRLIR